MPLESFFVIDMNKNTLILVCWAICASALHSQTISMDFPAFSGKTYELTIFQGSRSIKVQEDTIPANGKFELKIPKDFAPYTGMCRWLLTNNKEGGGLDMSIPGHGFSVSCASAKPAPNNIVYQGYDPVNELLRLNEQQQSIIDKYQLMRRAAELYGKGNILYPVFEKEMVAQQRAFDNFASGLKQNASYAAKFLSIVNITKAIPPHLNADYNTASKDIANYIASHLNLDDLYTSGHWGPVLDTWVQIEVNVIRDDNDLVASFNKMGDRITDPVSYTDFVRCITEFLTRYAKDREIALLTPFVLNSGKMSSYQGILSVYQNQMVGKQAPALVITERIGTSGDQNFKTAALPAEEFATAGYSKTLLVFYETGCSHCEELMAQLPSNYELLKRKGMRVITISSDIDEGAFKSLSRNFPWKDIYCDFKGFDGVNFKNYAVVGTPTIYLIGKSGKIEANLATMQQILDRLK